MKRLKLLLLILVMFGAYPVFSAPTKAPQTQPQTQPQKEAPLPLTAAHKHFLEDTYWIMSDYEKNAFISLKSDADRDRFIQAFWENRDPTPGTEKNEFKEEHYKRLEYVKIHYSRESDLPGYKTDRGRTYILLGKPRFITREGNPFEFEPMEMWTYTGLTDYGLPGSLYLLFYQKNSVGAYRLYSPISDGIQSLLLGQTSHRNMTDSQVYDLIRTQVDPEIAFATLSSIPTESGDPSDLSRSITTEIVQSQIQNARNYDLKKRQYVDAFIHDRPTVQVFYSIGGDGIYDGVYWFQAPTGNFYLNYGIEYRPDKLDMGEYEDYYTSLALDGQITTPDKIEIDEIKGSHEIKLTPDQFKNVESYPFQYLGIRPLIPGKYGITLIMTNNVSRRGTTFAHDIEIPDMSKVTTPFFTPILPVLAVEKASTTDGKIRPFQFGEKIYIPNVQAKFSYTGGLQVFHQVMFPDNFVAGNSTFSIHYLVKSEDKIETEATEALTVPAAKLAGNSLDIFKTIPMTGLQYGRKQLVVELMQGDKPIATATPLPFNLETDVSTMYWKCSVAIPDYQSSYHSAVLAEQLMKLKRPDESVALLENALATNPNSKEIRLQLMRAALKAREFSKVIELGTPMEVNDPRNSELNWLMGWANYGMEKYQDAVNFFERMRLEDANKVELLNVLADLYYRLDQRTKSLEIVQQSLALKPDQKDILELKKKLESKQ